jgi:hypothetical protein
MYHLFLGNRTAAAPAIIETPTVQRRGAMYPGGWIPEKLYSPPRKKLKKRALKQLKELYEEAHETIPEDLQVSLVPPEVLFRARAVATLPPIAAVDFEKLARSLETIKVLIAAVEAQRDRAKRRKRDEATILSLLAEMLSAPERQGEEVEVVHNEPEDVPAAVYQQSDSSEYKEPDAVDWTTFKVERAPRLKRNVTFLRNEQGRVVSMVVDDGNGKKRRAVIHRGPMGEIINAEIEDV